MPTGVYKRTDKHIEINRIGHKGMKMPEETKNKISQSLIGKKRSEETRRKISEANKGVKSKFWKNGNSLLRTLEYKESVAGRKRPDKCEICGGKNWKRAMQFDHCHKTGKFRGWICSSCNVVLGLVKDNQEILKAMIEYLAKANEQICKS